jgi:hypothetical protein
MAGTMATNVMTAVRPWKPSGPARSRAMPPRPDTRAPRARLRVLRSTDTKAMTMATPAQAMATPSPASSAPAPAGRNHVQRRAVAPSDASAATSAALQNMSVVSSPVGRALVRTAAATAVPAMVTP